MCLRGARKERVKKVELSLDFLDQIIFFEKVIAINISIIM